MKKINWKKNHFFFLCENIEKCPFTYWLNGRWFLQIVDRDSGNLYPIYPLFPCSDLLSQMCYFQHFYKQTKNLEKPFLFIYCFLRVFFMLDLFPTCLFFWKYWKVPLYLPFAYWLNGRWFLQIVEIGNFTMKLSGRWFPHIVDIGTVGIYIQYI